MYSPQLVSLCEDDRSFLLIHLSVFQVEYTTADAWTCTVNSSCRVQRRQELDRLKGQCHVVFSPPDFCQIAPPVPVGMSKTIPNFLWTFMEIFYTTGVLLVQRYRYVKRNSLVRIPLLAMSH